MNAFRLVRRPFRSAVRVACGLAPDTTDGEVIALIAMWRADVEHAQRRAADVEAIRRERDELREYLAQHDPHEYIRRYADAGGYLDPKEESP